MYVCMYVCIYVCMYAYMYVCRQGLCSSKYIFIWGLIVQGVIVQEVIVQGVFVQGARVCPGVIGRRDWPGAIVLVALN